MVDRIRNLGGDPRYYLAELQQSPKNDKRISEHVVFIHRLPYMKMSEKQHKKINYILFTVLIICVWDPNGYCYSEYLYDYSCVIRAMLDIMILPGLFMFYKFREKWLQEEVDVP